MTWAMDMPDPRGYEVKNLMGYHFRFCNIYDAPISELNNQYHYVTDSFYGQYFLLDLIKFSTTYFDIRDLYRYAKPHDYFMHKKPDWTLIKEIARMMEYNELLVLVLRDPMEDDLPSHIYENQPMAGSSSKSGAGAGTQAAKPAARRTQSSAETSESSSEAAVYEPEITSTEGAASASTLVEKPEVLLFPEKVDWNSSGPSGLEVKDPRDYQVGREMYESLLEKGLEADIALTVSRELLESGVSEPDVVSLPAGSELYKIVPEASGAPGENSPYFMTKGMLESLPEDPTEAGSYLGLPQVASSYDVYSIQAKTDVVVYQSEIAPYSVNDGTFQRSGGGVQTLVLNRKQFTSPKLLGK